MSKPYVIVISRQFGSGGHEIGVKLAEKLGIPLYDKEILAKVAEEKGIEEERLHKMDENLMGNHLQNVGIQAAFFRQFNPGYLFETDTSAVISRNHAFEWQSAVIRKLAEEGSCIIIGRCADYVLRDHPGLISVFISAPLTAREARIARLHPDHPREFRETHLQFIERTDKVRESYYHYHTDRDWKNIDHYHICADSSKLGIDGTVELLANYVSYALK